VAEQHGYDLIMYNTEARADKERKCINLLIQGRVDGIVGVFFHVTARDLINLLIQGRVDGIVGVFFHVTARDLLTALEQNIFVVRLEAREKAVGTWPLDNIFVDNIAAARTATTYLIEQGHTHIGMLASQNGPSQFRLQGYREALKEHNLPVNDDLIRIGSFNADGGYETVQQLLELDRRPSAGLN